jgi:tetratricopeptide (TPR) repeat protein
MMGSPDDGRQWMNLGKALLDSVPHTPEDEIPFASLTVFAHDVPRARAELEHAYTLAERNGLRTLMGRALSNLATVDIQDGRLADSLGKLQRALDILLPELGSYHPDLAIIHENMAEIDNALHRPKDALGAVDKALAIERALGSDGERVGFALLERAKAQVELGRADEGEHDARDAIALFARVVGPKSYAVADGLAMRGEALAKKGESDAAVASVLEAAAILEHHENPINSQDYIEVLIQLGRLYLSRREPARARPVLERALALAERAERADEVTAEAQFLLAQTAGSPAAATRLAQAARARLRGMANADPRLLQEIEAFVASNAAGGVRP